MLELGCGSGHSLRYAAEHGAEELWGVDLSATQIAFATETLQGVEPRVRLFESPMEVNPGIPADYFDLVFSIYGIGWTTDLPATLTLVAESLKPGGALVFSGEHPAYRSLDYTDGHYVFSTPYSAEGSTVHDGWNGAPTVIQHRTLGTVVTAVAQAGLCVEELVDGSVDITAATEAHQNPARWYSIPRARLMPTTFILKARKPATSPYAVILSEAKDLASG